MNSMSCEEILHLTVRKANNGFTPTFFEYEPLLRERHIVNGSSEYMCHEHCADGAKRLIEDDEGIIFVNLSPSGRKTRKAPRFVSFVDDTEVRHVLSRDGRDAL